MWHFFNIDLIQSINVETFWCPVPIYFHWYLYKKNRGESLLALMVWVCDHHRDQEIKWSERPGNMDHGAAWAGSSLPHQHGSCTCPVDPPNWWNRSGDAAMHGLLGTYNCFHVHLYLPGQTLMSCSQLPRGDDYGFLAYRYSGSSSIHVFRGDLFLLKISLYNYLIIQDIK